MEVEVDYVRIYQPITSVAMTGSEARWQPAVVAAAARDEYAVLDLVESMLIVFNFGKGIDDNWFFFLV